MICFHAGLDDGERLRNLVSEAGADGGDNH